MKAVPDDIRPWKHPRKELTPRQVELVRYVCLGLNNKEIAEKMKITWQTVEAHRGDAYRILGVNNTAQLVIEALKRRIVTFTKRYGMKAMLVAVVLLSSPVWAGDFKQDGSRLVITLETAGTHHTTAKGTTVLDTIHGTLPDGARFQARVYRPAVKAKVAKIVPCSTDSDCEAKNP